MIYSKKLQTNIPVTVRKQTYDLSEFGRFTKYIVSDEKIPIGYVDVKDTTHGIHVEMIKNNYPELYSGFGSIADQIEVEHCLSRNMDTFSIESDAALNSHALHYKRGKRFGKIPDLHKRQKLKKDYGTFDVNKIIEKIIETTKEGEKYMTEFLGKIPMYMPKKMIKKYIELAKHTPLLK